jgi:hypothetical protein
MTDRMHSSARRFAVVAGAALLAACGSDSTAPLGTGTDAARAAQTFAQLADSVARNGGDADVGSAYSGIAGILRMGGHVTPIVLTIDGVATPFIAAAMTSETTVNNCPPNAQCFAPPQTYLFRSLIAWDKENPKRIVQLTSASNDEQIGAILDPSSLALYARMASLIFMDGAGGTYIGTSGTQKFDVTKSNTPCPAVADSNVKVGFARPNVICTLADHAVAFSGKVEPSPFFLTGNSAKGNHSIAMSGQTVAGTRRVVEIAAPPSCDSTCAKPPVDSGARPPVFVRPSNELPSKLAVTADSVVNLTFTVVNSSKDPVKVEHPSGQKYDFVAIDSTTGREAWRWSAGKGFTQAFVTETVPAGGALTYVEQWKPARKGLYLIHALLVSTSHRSEAYTTIVVP